MEGSEDYLYMFRFCCDPGFNDVEELDALSRLVDEALIDDVMVFANVQEINTGHMSFAEQDDYLALMERVQEMLEPRGVTMSVNQWHSIMHADAGKKLRADQDFGLMVDPDGMSATLCVCPLDESWQRYIAELYARYARLTPRNLWVEDDFRLHNHAPLNWGGCFCARHLELFATRIGHPVSREEFVRGVLAPGDPHPYRRVWLDTARDTLIAVAARIERAVREVSAVPRLALMSSVPSVHAVEGRDWPALLGAFAGEHRPADRIHLPAYVEPDAADYLMAFNRVSMLTRAVLPPEAEVYPELENFPYSRFAKSRRFTRFQLLAAQPLNPDGMTIDLFDLNGNGIMPGEGYERMLREVKPHLVATRASGTFGSPAVGVRVMHDPRSSWTLHTATGKRMDELAPRETLFAALLPAMGVPFSFCADPGVRGEVIAVSGQYLRNLTPEEVGELLEGNAAILDAEAVESLVERGLGELVGAHGITWSPAEVGRASYEQFARPALGISRPRVSTMILSADAALIDYEETAALEVLSTLHASDRSRLATGEVVVDGSILVLPFGRVPDTEPVPRMMLNPFRQEVLQKFVARHARTPLPLVLDSPHVHPYAYESAGALSVYLVNGSSDPLDGLRLRWPGEAPRRVELMASGPADSRWRTVPFALADGVLTIAEELPSLESVLVRLEGDAQ